LTLVFGEQTAQACANATNHICSVASALLCRIAVRMEFPADANIIIGQSHFISKALKQHSHLLWDYVLTLE
jgi:hypothetical protein